MECNSIGAFYLCLLKIVVHGPENMEHISARALRTKAEYNHAPISIQLLRAMLHCALGVLYAGLDHHLQEMERSSNIVPRYLCTPARRS